MYKYAFLLVLALGGTLLCVCGWCKVVQEVGFRRGVDKGREERMSFRSFHPRGKSGNHLSSTRRVLSLGYGPRFHELSLNSLNPRPPTPASCEGRHTPFGPMPDACVREVPSGSRLVSDRDNANTMHLTHPDGRLETVVAPDHCQAAAVEALKQSKAKHSDLSGFRDDGVDLSGW